MKPFAFGSTSKSGQVLLLTRQEMGAILESLRVSAELSREGSGKSPRTLNRIGRGLSEITGSKWEDE